MRPSDLYTSFIDVPSLVCLDPKYLNRSTSFSVFCIHPYVGKWSWLDVVDENFAFVEAEFHPYPAAVFASISVSFWSSSSLPPSRSMSSANRKLQSGRSPMDAEVSKTSALSFPDGQQESQPICVAVRNATSLIPQRLSSIILAITCSENVHASPCIDSHGRIDRDNNTTPTIYVMHRSIGLTRNRYQPST